MSEPEVEVVALRQVIDPYDASNASNAMIEAGAAEAFRCDDLRGHVNGRWDWDTIPAEGRRDYRALVVAVLNAAIAETDSRAAVMCACGHGLHVHDAEAHPYLCEVCGDNTRCDYADPEAIAADRWEEGWIAAAEALCPSYLEGAARVLWVLEHMPTDEQNPYKQARERDDAEVSGDE